jgi:hypothetical protein
MLYGAMLSVRLHGPQSLGVADMTAAEIIERLEGAKSFGPDTWRARCPVHKGKSLSLKVTQTADSVLIHCFAECSVLDVLETIGLRWTDLFGDSTRHQYVEANRHVRHTLNPRDALALLDRESLVILLAAGDVLKAGEQLSTADLERVTQARERIAAVLEVLP